LEDKVIELQKADGEEGAYFYRPPKQKYTLNIILFFATLLTTILVGTNYYISFYLGEKIPKDPELLRRLVSNPLTYLWGLPYALTIMGILFAHEMGHYISSRIHGVDATLPYFIPAPTLIGTFGAVIRMKSPITSKRALFDIGIAGPLSGFIVAIPAIIYGIKLSRHVPAIPTREGIYLGEPLIMKIIYKIFYPDAPSEFTLLLHPIAFAAWFGILATAFNLFPIGQLDGGHILYSVIGRKTEILGKIFVLILIAMGFIFWEGWLIWAGIIIILGTKHPPVYEDEPLDGKRKFLAIIALLMFVLSFTPVPIKRVL
jgi:membrane-associated protease RseP (regulator of RpoE activity)